MTAEDWSIVASMLGFLGSLMLFYPGSRVSRSLKTIERLRAVVDRPAAHEGANKKEPQPQTAQLESADEATDTDASRDPGPELVKILEEQHAAWRPLEHWLLIGGILLIILSFGADLFLVKLMH